MSDCLPDDNESFHSAALERLASDGFVLIPELCNGSLLELMLDVAHKKTGEVREALGTQEIGIGSAAGYKEIVQRSPGRWDVPIAPWQFGCNEKTLPWWPLVAAVLGEDAEYTFSGVVSSEPGSPAQYWHIDSPHVAPEHRAAHAINILVALHDVPLAMGPTECARGSHRFTNHLNNTRLVVNELVYQHAGTSPEVLVKGTQSSVPESCATRMAAGSCLVFDDRLLHRGLANRSNATRHMVYFSYRCKGYCVNTHFESQRSVFDSGHNCGQDSGHDASHVSRA